MAAEAPRASTAGACRGVRLSAAAWAGILLLGAAPAVADAGAEARDPRALVTAMEQAFAAVEDYHCRAELDVVNGGKRTRREGSFHFRRPHQVLLKAGPVGMVFRRDGSIRGWLVTRLFAHGHKPEDEALYDVRGRRYDRYALSDVIAEARTLVEAAASAEVEEPADGTATLSLVVVPLPGGALSRRVYAVDPELMLPVGWTSFEGAAQVESVWCRDLVVNSGLKEELFR